MEIYFSLHMYAYISQVISFYRVFQWAYAVLLISFELQIGC
jgi:hypothetical protein